MSGIVQATRATPRMDLGKAVEEYQTEENEFIGTNVLPIFETEKKESTFPKITRESMTRDADTKRASGSNYNRDGIEAEDGSYACEEHGLEGVLDDSKRALYKSDFDAELAVSKMTMRRVLQAQEVRIANLVLNTTTFTGASLYTDYSSAPWDDVASDVITQVRGAMSKVRANCGLKANALIISETNLNRLKASTVIKDAIKYVKALTDEELAKSLASLFGVQSVMVGLAIRNSAKEGKEFVGSDIWSDDFAMVARLVTDPKDLSQPGLGRTFLWAEDSPDNATVEEYRDEKARSDVYRCRQNVDELIIDKYFGHMLKVDA